MNEIVQLVQQKTGLSQDMAETVVNTIVGYMKEKMPASMSSSLDMLLGGSTTAAVGAEATAPSGLADKAKSMMAGLGGMLGHKDS